MDREQKESFWFEITKQDKYVAVADLMKENGDDTTFYLLLILSSVIISAGALLANSAILIGGMLITPVLSPVLLVGLGFTLGNVQLIKRSVKKILKAFGIVFVIAFLAALIFDIPQDKEFFSSAIFNNTTQAAFLYFLVAFSSGVAATYAWIRKKVDNILPGISIAVSVVPPVAMTAIFLGREPELMRFFLTVFLFNMVGIIGGSMILFSLFRFHHTNKVVEKKIEREEMEKAESTITINEDEEIK